MSVHVYRARDQPATSYLVVLGSDAMRLRNPKKRRIQCFKCRRMRNAENMIVHVYYDGHYYFCRKGGCTKVKPCRRPTKSTRS